MPPPSHLSSSTNIQAHLYDAFLSHETCDVSLICVGAGPSGHGDQSASQWTASYESHRVVLIQAGYFKSLFTSGFVESSRSSSPRANSKRDTPSRGRASSCAELDVRLQFDDPNITRAAFELCLARLYGGGPPLHLAEDLCSTASHPLTSSFPLPPSSLFPSSSSARSIPAGHHPATPRFLLSLLATATYLAMSSVASEALGLIMLSVGPWTVMRYLRFAIGEGIGLSTDDDAYDDDIRSAVGLEHVAHDLLDAELDPMGAATVTRPFVPLRAPSIRSHHSVTSQLTATIFLRSSGRGGDTSSGVRDPDFEVIEKSQGMSSDEDDPLDTPKSHEHDGNDDMEDEDIPRYFYGAVGNQIGEACACWIARWSGDILDYEEAIFVLRKGEGARTHTSSASTSSSVGVSPASIDPLSTVAGKALSGLHSATSSKGTTSFVGRRRSDIVLWGNGGLSVRWVRGVISSDAFFVADENERYHFAVRVHRLRQAMREANYGNLPKLTSREQEIENREWEELFRTGIYYSHMSFQDLRDLESDGFVAPETITFAHWTHSVFRNSIVSARPPYHQPHAPTGLSNSISALSLGPSISSTAIGNSRAAASPPAQPRDLGLMRTTAEIKASLEDNNPMRATQAARKTYFPVFGDGSARFGYYNSSSNLPTEPPDHLNPPLFSTGDGMGTQGSTSGDGKPVATARKPLGETGFFGLGNARRTARMVPQEDPSGTAKWTEFEPFRFSIEWWDADTLKEKARLYSVTRSYAGSLFNVYIQVVRRRGLQLGLYLHRQSVVDPVPLASSAPGSRERSTSGAGPMLRHSPSSILSPRALDAYGPSEVPMQISTRISQLTGAVSSSPPTPTSTLTQLPNIPRVGSPGASPVTGVGGIGGITPSSTFPGAAGSPRSSISTTYTTYFRSASPANNPHADSYRDPRASVRAYFSITCPSASGTSMTTFRSGPDDFATDGSWGWRSSACVEIPNPPLKESPENENARADAGPPKDRDSAAVRQWLRELTSVRAAIVIGVV